MIMKVIYQVYTHNDPKDYFEGFRLRLFLIPTAYIRI